MRTTARWILLCHLLSGAALADALVIQETESLYQSLDAKDDARPALALRLADQLFNETLEVQKSSENTAVENTQIANYRKKSIRLYQASLSGLDGIFPKPAGEQKYKIQFQLARLYADEGRTAEADTIWRELAAQKEYSVLRREAALRLAEEREDSASEKGLKEAEQDYDLALSLCENGDLCSYVHYRKAWIFHKTNRPQQAIAEMKLALFDSKKQVREESLRDLIVFLASRPTDGKEDLVLIQDLEKQLGRSNKLSQDLSDAYFAQGNQKAGVFVLEQVNAHTPTPRGYARLLEEEYGFRNWDKFHSTLESAEKFFRQDHPQGFQVNEIPDVEKILRRLTVQLDGERATQKRVTNDFEQVVLFYLSAFPQSTERAKMIDGWLAAETEPVKKLEQLQTWIAADKASGATVEEAHLREVRAAIAQKSNQYQILAEEMAALKLGPETARHREFAYQEAHAYYQEKAYDKALPLFTDLAALTLDQAPDKWAIQSQNLALDIVAAQKNYEQVINQANLWLNAPSIAQWAKLSSDNKREIEDMKRIATAARFEKAVAAGKSPESLQVFSELCLAHEFLPRSCDNAKILAVQLNDSDKLVSVLKTQGDQSALAAELEGRGEFYQAAELQEKMTKGKQDTRSFLRIALLYELGGKLTERDRVLKQMLGFLGKKKTLGPDERLIFETLHDAHLMDAQAFKLPWSKIERLRLADQLEFDGHGTVETKRAVEQSCAYTGPAWIKNANKELDQLDDHQRQISFEGVQGQKKFKLRLAALKKLEVRSECFVKEAPPAVRVPILARMNAAYLDLAQQILDTPLPEAIDQAASAQIKEALEKMAAPFNEKSQLYRRLTEQQMEKTESPDEKQAFETRVLKDHNFTIQTTVGAKSEVAATEATVSSDLLAQARAELKQNPDQPAAIEKFKTYYGSTGQKRLAAYFEGRLIQSKKEVQQ